MMKTFSPAPLHVKYGLGLFLAGSIVLHSAMPGYTAGFTQKALPLKDFLPPVATINSKLVEKTEVKGSEDLEPIALSAVQSPVIHATPKIEKLNTDLSAQIKTEELKSLVEIQQKVDEADLEYLWQATVEKNPVIRFSLEKLATPTDLQTKQSSRFMTKTLSTLINGATMASTFVPGGGMYRNMGAMALGNAAQNMVNGKTPINGNSLSATEQIQLAGLVDELKIKLIQNYQDYKNTLQNLAQSHQVTAKNNDLYSKALTSKNDLAIMAAGTAYYQALSAETAQKQKAKLYRMELERLAGPEAVKRLELAVHVSETVGTANMSPALESPLAEPAEMIGPMPIETAPSASVQTSETLIGPELPPAKIKTLQKASKSHKSLLKNEVPQPMEIGPKLKESYREPLPTLFDQTASTLEATSQENVSQ